MDKAHLIEGGMAKQQCHRTSPGYLDRNETARALYTLYNFSRITSYRQFSSRSNGDGTLGVGSLFTV